MNARFLIVITILSAQLLFAACSSDGEMIDANLDSPATEVAVDTSNDATPDPLQRIDEDAPLAVISTRSLRVRSEPSEDAKVIFSVKQREIYAVLALSADGKFVELEIADAPGGHGWVDANFVTMQGDITNIERGVVPSTETPSPETPSAETPSALPTPTPAGGVPAIVKTDGQRLRVRKEPKANAAVIGRVTNGEEVTVLEQSEDGKWAKIAADEQDNPDGGWVATEFLKLEK